jgi:hypothetical protein
VPGNILRWKRFGIAQGNFQSSLRTFRLPNLYPGLRPISASLLADNKIRKDAGFLRLQLAANDFVGILTKNILNKLALMGLRPGLSSAVPVQIRFEKRL